MKRIIVMLSLLLTACTAPQLQPFALAAHTSHLTEDTQYFIAADNVPLPVRSWLPRTKPRAIIVALHGFNDYSNAFAIPAPVFNKQGIGIYAIDQRGFGESPDHGIWAGEDNLTRDANDFIRVMQHKYPDVPLYVLGESMGGAVAISALSQPDAPSVTGLILVAPAVWEENILIEVPLWMLVHMWPDKKFTGANLHIKASDNIPMLRALSLDPLVIKSTRADTIYGLVQLMDSAHSRIGHLCTPVLLLYGAHDQVIPSSSVKEGARQLKKDDKVVYYTQGYHMLLRDIHRDIPIKDIISWIKNKDEPLPSGEDDHTQQWLK